MPKWSPARRAAGSSHTRISYFGMMSDSKDIDIMYGLRAACVSGPTSTYDALGCGMETRLWKTCTESEKSGWRPCPNRRRMVPNLQNREFHSAWHPFHSVISKNNHIRHVNSIDLLTSMHVAVANLTAEEVSVRSFAFLVGGQL